MAKKKIKMSSSGKNMANIQVAFANNFSTNISTNWIKHRDNQDKRSIVKQSLIYRYYGKSKKKDDCIENAANFFARCISFSTFPNRAGGERNIS